MHDLPADADHALHTPVVVGDEVCERVADSRDNHRCATRSAFPQGLLDMFHSGSRGRGNFIGQPVDDGPESDAHIEQKVTTPMGKGIHPCPRARRWQVLRLTLGTESGDFRFAVTDG